MSRPTVDPCPFWATDTNFDDPGHGWDGEATKVEPSNPAQGFVPAQPVPAEWVNYLLAVHSDWVRYFEECMPEAHVAKLESSTEVTSGSLVSVLTITDFAIATGSDEGARTWTVDAQLDVATATGSTGLVILSWSIDGELWTDLNQHTVIDNYGGQPEAIHLQDHFTVPTNPPHLWVAIRARKVTGTSITVSGTASNNAVLRAVGYGEHVLPA